MHGINLCSYFSLESQSFKLILCIKMQSFTQGFFSPCFNLVDCIFPTPLVAFFQLRWLHLSNSVGCIFPTPLEQHAYKGKLLHLLLLVKQLEFVGCIFPTELERCNQRSWKEASETRSKDTQGES